jgi:hypothetical protein
MSADNDKHGQPPRAYYAERVNDRLVAELLGVCKGIICDGLVNDSEAIALRQWIASHPDVAMGFPGKQLYERLAAMFEDGEVDVDERIELEDLLRELSGEDDTQHGDLNRAMSYCFDHPTPTLLFDGWEYCLTGRFAYGTRERCERAITDRGGRTVQAPRAATHVVVVGTYGSEAWVQSTYGGKILTAMDIKKAGRPIRIVPESHWVWSLAAG